MPVKFWLEAGGVKPDQKSTAQFVYGPSNTVANTHRIIASLVM